VANGTAKAFLWAAGIGMIGLSQIESSEEFPGEEKEDPYILGVKKRYALIHAVTAISFLFCSLVGVLLIEGDYWVSKGLAIAGACFFIVAVLTQNSTGNW
jgi:hypothetical protein